MILSVGFRTDIVSYYGEWLMKRFSEGYVYVRNPLFPGKVSRYDLSPAKLDAILFRSKNYAPFLGPLETLAKKYRLYCQYVITPYGRELEPNPPAKEERIADFLNVERIVGREKLAWRYDPVLKTEKYSPAWHLKEFESIAARLAGHTDKCIFNFVEMYIKLQQYMPELIPLTREEKFALAKGFADIALRYGIPLSKCGNAQDYAALGVLPTPCVTLASLGKANGCVFKKARHNGNRRDCFCIESRDVGAYDCCPGECLYCSCNRDRAALRGNISRHDPSSPFLIGGAETSDEIISSPQISFLKSDGNQLSLFDL